MKIIISIVIIAGCGFVGVVIKNYYKNRKQFYCNLLEFINNYSINVNFNRDTIVQFVNNLPSNDCNNLIKNLFLNTNAIKLDYLHTEEIQESIKFLSSLGQLDAENELSFIQENKLKFTKIYDKCEKDYQKLSPLALKMSVLVGLTIVIILI